MNVLKNNMELRIEHLVKEMKLKGYIAMFSFETITIEEADGTSFQKMGIVIRFQEYEDSKIKPELIFLRSEENGYKYRLKSVKYFEHIKLDMILVRNVKLFPILSEIFILNQKKVYYLGRDKKKKK